MLSPVGKRMFLYFKAARMWWVYQSSRQAEPVGRHTYISVTCQSIIYAPVGVYRRTSICVCACRHSLVCLFAMRTWLTQLGWLSEPGVCGAGNQKGKIPAGWDPGARAEAWSLWTKLCPSRTISHSLIQGHLLIKVFDGTCKIPSWQQLDLWLNNWEKGCGFHERAPAAPLAL